MSERYTRLFSLHGQFYATGSPVLIAAGALLKDNVSGKVLVQLKLQNVGDKPIKAVTVKIFPLDTVAKPLGEPVIYQYLDLNNVRGSQFCQKSPVYLPDASTRSFSAVVTEVCFTDNTTWSNVDADWKPLPIPQKLPITDAELLKQYRLEYGQDCEYSACQFSDLWYCACGALNRQSENKCYRCGKSFSVLNNVDMNALAENRDKRLEQEKIAKEEAQEKAAKTRKKTIKIAAIIAPIVCVCIAFIIVLMTVIIPNINAENEKAVKYASANDLVDNKKFSEAIEIFSELGEYKDSAKRLDSVKEIAYLAAKQNLDAGRYLNAVENFKELGDYKDSAAIVREFINYKDVSSDEDINRLIKFYNGSKYFKNKSALEKTKKLAPYCGSWRVLRGSAYYQEFTIGYSVDPNVDNSELVPTIDISLDEFSISSDSLDFLLIGSNSSNNQIYYFVIEKEGILKVSSITDVMSDKYDGNIYSKEVEYTKK